MTTGPVGAGTPPANLLEPKIRITAPPAGPADHRAPLRLPTTAQLSPAWHLALAACDRRAHRQRMQSRGRITPNTIGSRYCSNAVDVDATMSTDFETGGPGPTRITASTPDDFSGLCCGRRHGHLLTDPESLSLHIRAGGIGPLTTADFVVDTEVALNSGDSCGSYVTLVRSGHAAIDYRGLSLVSGPGDANVYGPDGNATNRWTPNSRIIAARIDPCA